MFKPAPQQGHTPELKGMQHIQNVLVLVKVLTKRHTEFYSSVDHGNYYDFICPFCDEEAKKQRKQLRKKEVILGTSQRHVYNLWLIHADVCTEPTQILK